MIPGTGRIQPRCTFSLPAVPGVVWQQEAVGLDLVDLAAADLEDLAGHQIDRPEVLGQRFHPGDAGNLYRPHIPAVNEHGKAENEALFLIHYHQAPRPDASDVAEIPGVDLISTVEPVDFCLRVADADGKSGE